MRDFRTLNLLPKTRREARIALTNAAEYGTNADIEQALAYCYNYLSAEPGHTAAAYARILKDPLRWLVLALDRGHPDKVPPYDQYKCVVHIGADGRAYATDGIRLHALDSEVLPGEPSEGAYVVEGTHLVPYALREPPKLPFPESAARQLKNATLSGGTHVEQVSLSEWVLSLNRVGEHGPAMVVMSPPSQEGCGGPRIQKKYALDAVSGKVNQKIDVYHRGPGTPLVLTLGGPANAEALVMPVRS